MTCARKQATVNSALWSAYGDALGFITELADQRILRQRLRADKVTALSSWTRRIGGRFGVDIDLPFGCYSDDTQLRLATSRAISASGEFDIEVFSKVELPVWLSYALGAGRGSKLAASSLARKDTRWFSNFYSGENANYVSSGGNGAAMRVQPHVLASKTLENPSSYLLDVLRNTVSTHGHPRAIAGAVFHALCLGRLLENGVALSISDLREINSWTTKIPRLIAEDPYLRDFWIPKWEGLSGETLQAAFSTVFEEIENDLRSIALWLNQKDHFRYSDLIEILRLSDLASRGSGTKTALAAAVFSILATRYNPNDLLLTIVNALGTDTDSIASMTGALIGAFLRNEIPQYPQDKQFIEQDAVRLYELSQGTLVRDFPYPGLMSWNPPKSAVDSVFVEDNKLVVSGLGPVTTLSVAIPATISRREHVYQWVQTQFGQRLLVKRRSDQSLGGNHVLAPSTGDQPTQSTPLKRSVLQNEFENDSFNNGRTKSISFNLTKHGIDELSTEAIQNAFDPSIIGSHILELIDSGQGIEHVIAYTAIIAKARISRLRKASAEKNKAKKLID